MGKAFIAENSVNFSNDTRHATKIDKVSPRPRLGRDRVDPRRTRNDHQSGFTIIELMVTLLVVSVLAGLAVPSFTEFMRGSRMLTVASELHQALFNARSEAAKRGININLESDSGTAAWEGGWVMYVDDDGDGIQDAGEDSIWVGEPAQAGYTITGSANQVRYLPSGALTVSPTVVTFTFCSDAEVGETGRTISIMQTGRPDIAAFGCP